MSEPLKRLSTLSSMSQHVATMQLVSCGQILLDPASLFWTKVIFADLSIKAFPRKHATVDISVFLWLLKQRPRFAGDKPKGCFQMKELERTAEAIARVNARWRKLSTLSSMCQHVATLLQFFRCAVKNKAFSRQHPCFRRR